ncbi:hypothetical protein Tco_0652791 [Tanacetum coccineum]|uniref:Uncharacterized protein n=1 Tax=Tanacetum coccineum TaxID=301880 RepID=A0ABQ4WYM0_9ASTR
MVASESGSPLQPPQAHPGAAFPRLLLHPRMRYLGKTISWRLCGITSISAFLFSNVDDVLTYVEGWQRVTIGRLSNLHRRTLRKLAMYSCVYNEKSKFGPVFSVQNFSRSTYMITGYDDCYNLTEMKWHVENMTSPGGATTRRHAINSNDHRFGVPVRRTWTPSLHMSFHQLHQKLLQLSPSGGKRKYHMKTKNKAVKRKLPFDYESASNKMTDIISKPLVVREIAETNGNTINIPARTCGDAKTSIQTHLQHPCCPGTSKRTQFPTTANRTSTINGNNVVANRDSRHHNYHVTTSQLSTGHIRRPFARTPSNFSLMVAASFGMGRRCMNSGFDPNVGAVQHIDSQQASLEQVIGSPYTGNKSNLTALSATAITPTTSTVAGSLVLRDVTNNTKQMSSMQVEMLLRCRMHDLIADVSPKDELTNWLIQHFYIVTIISTGANIGEQHSSFSGTQNVPVQQIPSQEMTTSSDIGIRQELGGLSATPTVVIHEAQPQTPVLWGEFSI